MDKVSIFKIAVLTLLGTLGSGLANLLGGVGYGLTDINPFYGG